MANFPVAVSYPMAVAGTGVIYAGGGLDSAGADSVKTAMYDPVGNTWNDAAVADLPAAPAPHWGAANAMLSGNWVVGPGASGGFIQSTSMQWDPVGNSWSNLPATVAARYRLGGAALGGAFYAIGGNPFGGTNDNQKLFCSGATPTPTATPSPGCANYGFTNSIGAIVSGGTDIGLHADDAAQVITLPFPIKLYGNTYTSAAAGSNGFLSFDTFINSFYTGCLPNSAFSYTIFPWEVDQDLRWTGNGIFTLTTGTTPNRSFYVEWRNCQYGSETGCLANSTANYQIVFDENNPGFFSIIYGTFGTGDTTAGAIGVQGASIAQYTQYQCNLGRPSFAKQIYNPCPPAYPDPQRNPNPNPDADTNADPDANTYANGHPASYGLYHERRI